MCTENSNTRYYKIAQTRTEKWKEHLDKKNKEIDLATVVVVVVVVVLLVYIAK